MDIVTFIETSADPNDPEWAYQFCTVTVMGKPVKDEAMPAAPWEIAVKDGVPVQYAGLRLYRAPKAYVEAERRREFGKAVAQKCADLAKYNNLPIDHDCPPIPSHAAPIQVGRGLHLLWQLPDERWIAGTLHGNEHVDGYAKRINGAWTPMFVSSNLTDAQFRALTKD